MSDPNTKHPPGDYTASQERLSKVARIDGFSDEEEGHESELSMSPENPRVQRYLVAIEYVGTRFFGSQQQPKDRTVVGVLQVIREVGFVCNFVPRRKVHISC